jgi:hypothetical protein
MGFVFKVLKLFMEIIVVDSKRHVKCKHTLCRRKEELRKVKAGATNSYHRACTVRVHVGELLYTHPQFNLLRTISIVHTTQYSGNASKSDCPPHTDVREVAVQHGATVTDASKARDSEGRYSVCCPKRWQPTSKKHSVTI